LGLPIYRVKARRQARKHGRVHGLVVVPMYPTPRWFWSLVAKDWSGVALYLDGAAVGNTISSAYPVSVWVDAAPGRHTLAFASERRSSGELERTGSLLSIDIEVGAVPVVYVKPATRSLLGRKHPAMCIQESINPRDSPG
jgi:hypothetical protein